MKVSHLIKHHEGLMKEAYLCPAGKITVGYGRNLEDKGITEGEAEILLNNDIQECVSLLQNFPFWLRLSEVRKAVVIDMCFNLGYAGLCKFKRMLAALEREDYHCAAKEMADSKWFDQVGKRAERLQTMMRSNEWPVLI